MQNRRTSSERFNEFHRNNPRVYANLVKLARETKAKGFNRYSIAGLFEVFRWQVGITTLSKDGFKISNDFKPHYARLIMAQESDLSTFFELRATKLPNVVLVSITRIPDRVVA